MSERMKIVAGLGSIDEYERYVKAGADEFFCGFVPYEWTRQYGIMLPLNRREVLYYHVQIGSFEELRILRRMVEVHGVPVKITFNSLFYLEEQYEVIGDLIEQCMSIGFDTFIIADVALILYLRNRGLTCRIHLSGECAEVNHKMMEVMNSFQIKRYIFHRKNTLEDMKQCIWKNQNMTQEYEAFILNEWCHFTGGFCNSLHCDELAHLCKVPYELGRIHKNAGRLEAVFHQDTSKKCGLDQFEEEAVCEDCNPLGVTGCGVCALFRLKQVGITHLKLVGRGNHPDDMERDIRVLKEMIHLADDCGESSEYIEKMKQRFFPHGCSDQCFYRGEC